MEVQEQLNPEEFIETVAVALPRSIQSERVRLLTHARAWANVRYPAALPEEVEKRLAELEGRWQTH